MYAQTDKSGWGETYSARSVANTVKRVRESFGGQVMLMYGDAANILCCNPGGSGRSAHFTTLVNSKPEINNRVLRDNGLFAEEVRGRAIRLYDSINGADVEIGVNHERFGRIQRRMYEITGEDSRQFAHTYLGILVGELFGRARSVGTNGDSVLVPSASHQLYLLHMLWIADSYEDYGGPHAAELIRNYEHHYGSAERLKNARHTDFGIGGKHYLKALGNDISKMLRR